ncbi:Conserved_hypothetical protein [Hexamita inflata]|uniref:Uncharacterized protein n=1 Tax=Hexamita inflata TaxID=28002 RepID=A0AA86TTF0_9EUKA|nr:Conserved hypothetical protein [Hexamita inflata]
MINLYISISTLSCQSPATVDSSGLYCKCGAGYVYQNNICVQSQSVSTLRLAYKQNQKYLCYVQNVLYSNSVILDPVDFSACKLQNATDVSLFLHYRTIQRVRIDSTITLNINQQFFGLYGSVQNSLIIQQSSISLNIQNSQTLYFTLLTPTTTSIIVFQVQLTVISTGVFEQFLGLTDFVNVSQIISVQTSFSVNFSGDSFGISRQNTQINVTNSSFISVFKSTNILDTQASGIVGFAFVLKVYYSNISLYVTGVQTRVGGMFVHCGYQTTANVIVQNANIGIQITVTSTTAFIGGLGTLIYDKSTITVSNTKIFGQMNSQTSNNNAGALISSRQGTTTLSFNNVTINVCGVGKLQANINTWTGITFNPLICV